MLDPKNKLHTFIVCSIAFIALILLWPFDQPQSSSPAAIESGPLIPQDPSPAIEAIKAEKNVIDMNYDASASIQWHIGVQDDGSKRYGYAGYICEILHKHGLVNQTTSVRIVDISKVNRGESFRKASLGRVNCATYQRYDY